MIHPDEKRSGQFTWIILLALALIALILTIVFGYLAFGPNDTLSR